MQEVAATAALRLVAAGRSDVGLVRKNNEDAFVCDPEHGLFAVADGMGGHLGGEVAADMAVSGLRQAFQTEIGARYLAEPSVSNRRQLLDFLAKTVNEISAAIYERARVDRNLHGMGCTLDVLLVRDHGLFLAHVGDSRSYGLLGGTLYQLTEDHSLAQSLLSSGALTAEEARQHPQGNLLVRAVGIYPKVEVDTSYLELAPGDVFMLCSDGVHGLVGTEALQQALQHEPEVAAETIIEAALDQGGRDNATAVVVHVAACEQHPPIRIGSHDIARAMARADLFAGFTEGELLRIQKIASGRIAAAGEQVLHQNQLCTDVFLILDGLLSAWRDGQRVGMMDAGDPFGGLSFSPEVHHTTMQVEREARLLVFPLEEIRQLLASDTALAAKLAMNSLQRVWQRLRGLTDASVRHRSIPETGATS